MHVFRTNVRIRNAVVTIAREGRLSAVRLPKGAMLLCNYSDSAMGGKHEWLE